MEVFISIGSIIIGWVLNELSSTIRYRSEESRRIKISIMYLMKMRFQIYEITRTFKIIAQLNKDINKIESERQRVLEKFTYSRETIFCEINRITENLAEVDPIIAMKVSNLSEGLDKFKKIKLNETCKTPELYIRHLLMIETTLQIAIKELEKIIKKISLKVNLLFYWRMKKALHDNKVNLNASFLDDLDKETVKKFMNYKKESDDTTIA